MFIRLVIFHDVSMGNSPLKSPSYEHATHVNHIIHCIGIFPVVLHLETMEEHSKLLQKM